MVLVFVFKGVNGFFFYRIAPFILQGIYVCPINTKNLTDCNIGFFDFFLAIRVNLRFVEWENEHVASVVFDSEV